MSVLHSEKDIDAEYNLLSTRHGSQTFFDDTELPRRCELFQVDFLSYQWKDPEIWATWSARKGFKTNSVRLVNASWRAWAQCKYCLKRISPEDLNW